MKKKIVLFLLVICWLLVSVNCSIKIGTVLVASDSKNDKTSISESTEVEADAKVPLIP